MLGTVRPLQSSFQMTWRVTKNLCLSRSFVVHVLPLLLTQKPCPVTIGVTECLRHDIISFSLPSDRSEDEDAARGSERVKGAAVSEIVGIADDGNEFDPSEQVQCNGEC